MSAYHTLPAHGECSQLELHNPWHLPIRLYKVMYSAVAVHALLQSKSEVGVASKSLEQLHLHRQLRTSSLSGLWPPVACETSLP